jgi:hypothetical protein
LFKGKRFMNKVVKKKKVSRGWEGKSERLRAFFQAASSVFGLTIEKIIATRAFSFLSKRHSMPSSLTYSSST